jgi:predicted phage-related endonuclease
MTAPVAHPRTDLNSQTALWLRAYIETKAEIRRLEETAEQARRHIEAALGDNEEGVLDGEIVVRWTHVNSTRVDLAKLRENHPDIAEAFTVSTSSRRFTIPDGT